MHPAPSLTSPAIRPPCRLTPRHAPRHRHPPPDAQSDRVLATERHIQHNQHHDADAGHHQIDIGDIAHGPTIIQEINDLAIEEPVRIGHAIDQIAERSGERERNITVQRIDIVRAASTAITTHATTASSEISHVLPDPRPSDAPGL